MNNLSCLKRLPERFRSDTTFSARRDETSFRFVAVFFKGGEFHQVKKSDKSVEWDQEEFKLPEPHMFDNCFGNGGFTLSLTIHRGYHIERNSRRCARRMASIHPLRVVSLKVRNVRLSHVMSIYNKSKPSTTRWVGLGLEFILKVGELEVVHRKEVHVN
jgi:hypothetical protein